jgi:parvulin-like peptidyl-prolyl isomerase
MAKRKTQTEMFNPRNSMKSKNTLLAVGLALGLAGYSCPPHEQELEAYLRQSTDKYREEPRFTFEHIFFNREKHGKSAGADAKAVLALLALLTGKNGAAIYVEKFGDAFLLPFRFEKISEGEAARLFGENFGKQLVSVETGNWAGLLESNYGLHLVRVDEHLPGAAPQLANVREVVFRDLLSERRKQELDAQYAKLRARYMSFGTHRVLINSD